MRRCFKETGLFSSFIDRIVIGDDIQIECQPDKVLNRHHLVSVQSGIDWLPDLDSNQGPAD